MPLEALLEQQTSAEDERLKQAALEERAQREESVKRLEAVQQEKAPEVERLGRMRDRVENLPTPSYTNPPPSPNTQQMLQPTNLQKTFGMASIFALLSVGLAKGNAVYGLKALGGFMEGAHASNVEQAKAALDDYNEKMKEVHEINDNAYREYNAIFNNTKMGMEAQTQMAHQAALKFDDQLQIENLRTGNLVEFNKIQNQRFKNQIEMDKAIGQTEALAERMRHDKAMENRATSGARPSKEEYELMLSARAKGQSTGNQLVDNLSPDDAAAKLKKGGATSTQERQELTALLTSYQKDAQAIQKKMDSYHLYSPPKELSEQLKDIKAKMLQVRSRLSEMSGLQGGALPPAGGTPKSKEERLKALGF
jgi:hypothetical protein